MSTLVDNSTASFVTSNLSMLVYESLNKTNPCRSYPKTLKDELVAKILIGFLYCVVFAISITGNSLVIYVVAANRHMQTVTNLFITNLAISDVVVSLSSLWITPMYMYLLRWIWGGPACYLFSLLQGGSIFISTFTLTAIALDRFVVILYPFQPRMKIHVCMLIIISIWGGAFVLVIPMILNIQHFPACGRFICMEIWSDRNLRKVYGLIVLILQYGIPFGIITLCYLLISLSLWRQPGKLVGARSSARQEAELRRKKRMNAMLILMVVMFAICWLPLNALNILRDAHKEMAKTTWFPLLFMLGHLIAMSATCWNPLIYAFMNEAFRREFVVALPCLRACRAKVSKPQGGGGTGNTTHNDESSCGDFSGKKTQRTNAPTSTQPMLCTKISMDIASHMDSTVIGNKNAINGPVHHSNTPFPIETTTLEQTSTVTSPNSEDLLLGSGNSLLNTGANTRSETLGTIVANESPTDVCEGTVLLTADGNNEQHIDTLKHSESTL